MHNIVVSSAVLFARHVRPPHAARALRCAGEPEREKREERRPRRKSSAGRQRLKCVAPEYTGVRKWLLGEMLGGVAVCAAVCCPDADCKLVNVLARAIGGAGAPRWLRAAPAVQDRWLLQDRPITSYLDLFAGACHFVCLPATLAQLGDGARFSPRGVQRRALLHRR